MSGRPSNGKPASAKGHTHPRSTEPEVNLQAVRIVAGVFAFVCLAGVVTALALQRVTVNAASIIEMVLVGILIALGIFTAVQPQTVTGWVSLLRKR